MIESSGGRCKRGEIRLVIPAMVLAGVDLEKVIWKKLKRKILILVKAYADTGFISGGTELQESFELAAIAQDEILKEAEALGVLKTAEENTVKALETFFNHIGYTANVTFK